MRMTSALSRPVNRIPSQTPGNSSNETLGDVLYPNGAGGRVSEADWVRLVQGMVAQDQQALRELYERSHRLVFTLMMRMTHSHESAEELTLDLFHELWKRASHYDPKEGTVLAWVMNQARSRAIDRLRFDRRQKRINPFPGEPFLENAASHAGDPSDVDERQGLLRGALRELTPEEREAIETAFFGELTHAEAAERLHTPLGTIKTRIRSGLAKLRQALVPGAKLP